MEEIRIIENTGESFEEFARNGWGQEEVILTKEQMIALVKGKSIGFSVNDEYTAVLTYERFKRKE